MSHATTYTLTFAHLQWLADTASYLDDKDIIPLDDVRKFIVRDLHSFVERIAGPDACLIYAEGA